MLDVIKIIVENEKGKILAVREKSSKKWELPGGSIEDKEGKYEAACRELEEEVNLVSTQFNDVVRVQTEAEKNVNCYIVHTSSFEGELSLDDEEIDRFKWVEPEKYKELDWHPDAGYGIPAVEKLDHYLGR